MKMNYTVKKLAKASGVSVRTLHHYDQIGLLKPSMRTEAGYRVYGQDEQLKLQQILFYKELDFSLQEIGEIIHNADFDIAEALQSHKKALLLRKNRIDKLIKTIDNTVNHLKKGGNMLKPEELYAGLDKGIAEQYRKEAMEKYGRETVENSEKSLGSMGKAGFEALKTSADDCYARLFNLRFESPESDLVQAEIAQHYAITRKFWGTEQMVDKQADAYAGLGNMYVNDERFTMRNGQAQPQFAMFLKKAMEFYAENHLR